MVRVGSVTVAPELVNAVQGERVQLVATVHDENDQALELAGVEWSSGNTSIASVDSRGLVDALAPGSVTITASFDGVSGATTVRVLRGPFVEVTPTSVELFTGPGVEADTRAVDVRNGGTGAVGEMSVETTYEENQPGGWLTAELAGTAPPTQLILDAPGADLPPGVYEAQVRVRSATNTAVLEVALNVAGFVASEVGGTTSLREGGEPEHLSVVLASRPGSAVVLDVRSAEPEQVTVSPSSLRFTPSSWNEPQAVTVRAVDDGEDDGDRTVAVTISVNDGESHDSFEELPDRAFDVTAVDDDDPKPPVRPRILVSETGAGTTVSELGTSDTILVAL